jgi:hypothetical protein
MERCQGGELHHGRGIERAVLDVLYDPKLNVPPRTEKLARTRLDTKTTPAPFAGPMVRIRFPPAGSLRTIGSVSFRDRDILDLIGRTRDRG